MNPDHDGQLACRFGVRERIHIQIETIFAWSGIEKEIIAPNLPLRATMRELRCVAHILPRGGRRGRLPAKIAHRRRSVGQPEKGLDLPIVGGFAMHLALPGFDGQGAGVNGGGESEQTSTQNERAGHTHPNLHRKTLQKNKIVERHKRVSG